MAMNVRRQTLGAILSTVLMLFTTFSVVGLTPMPVTGELVEETASDNDPVNDEMIIDGSQEVTEPNEKSIPSDLQNLDWPEVVYPSGLGGNNALGDLPAGMYSYSSDLLDRQGVEGAWAQGVNGSGVNVALIDTGIDLAHPDLVGTYATDDTILGSVAAEVVVDGASAAGVTQANLVNMYVINLDLKKSGGQMFEGTDYTFYAKEGRIVFTSSLNSGDHITASYDYTSPYYGWPIAFDPVSMSNFLEQNHTKDTWYANTTQVGPGPFEYSHTLIIDGETEFGGTYEKWGTDPSGGAWGAPDGIKEDWDLQNLNLTYDKDFWYVGFPTFMRVQTTNASVDFVPQVTFGVFFDVDNETGGTTTDPEGRLIDTNTSHSDDVLDAEFSPDGSMIATVSRDNLVRIWSASDALRIATMFDHESTNNPPFSVAWSDDGTKLASISKDRLFIWNVGSWDAPYETLTIVGGPDIDTDIYGLSSFLAFSPNNQEVAYGGEGIINFWHFETPSSEYYLEVSPITKWVRALAYKPYDEFTIAANLDTWTGPEDPWFMENAIGVYDLSTAVFGDVSDPRKPNKYLLGHIDIVLSIAWSPAGDRIVSGSSQGDMTVRIWDLTPPMPIETSSTNVLRPIPCVDWSSNDEITYGTVRWLAPNEEPTLNTMDQNGAPLQSVQGRMSWFSCNWAPNGNSLVTSSADLSARIWDRNLDLVRVLVAQKPDFALYVVAGDRYNKKDAKWEPGFQPSTFYVWDDVTGWTGTELKNTTIHWPERRQMEAFQIFGASQFIEFAIPRVNLTNPSSMAVEMFSVPYNDTHHAQDSVPSDVNVFRVPEDGPRAAIGKDLNWRDVNTSLSTFTWKGIKYFYTDVGLSKSGEFHFGFHPSPHLTLQLGIVGVLVVDSERPYDYDTVYVDMNVDNVFDGLDPILTRDSPTALYYDSVTGDNVSGGIMYYISDGYTPIPYSIPYSERRQETDTEFKNVIPPNGDIVTFIGEFFIDEDTNAKATHGTQLASVIASQGLSPLLDLNGIAPGAKFVVLANTQEEIEHSWYFAVEGYDGEPGTGDEAQIVLNAFNYPRVIEKGWDRFSRLADSISILYADEASLFVGPGGDYGWGYGTISSPNAAPGVVTVGRASSFTRHYGDVEISSSRGPTPVGLSKPDVVAIGLSEVLNPEFLPQQQPGLLKGGDVSSAVTVGILALIYEAYKSRNGVYPTATQAKEILMSGADDTHNDPLSQGAGFVNATRSVSIALGNGGLSASPSTYSFGSFQGVNYPSFTNILAAGDTDVKTFTVFNNGNSAISASLDATIYNKTGEFYLSNSTVQDGYALDREIVFWINSSGISKVKDEGAGVYTIHQQVVPFNATLWNTAELVKITAYSSYDRMTNVASVSPTGTKTYFKNYSYMMDVYDWTMNPMNSTFPSIQHPGDLFYMAESFSFANVRLGVDPMTNVMEARIHNPASRVDEGLVVALNAYGDTPPDKEYTWEFLIEVYEKDDWSWLTLSPPNIPSISAFSNDTFSATLQVPQDAKVGSYEGAVHVTNDATGEVTTIPLLANIAINSPNLEFGGVNNTSDLYDNNRIFGGYDKGMAGSTRLSKPYTGDWRFYYFDIPDAGIYKSAGLKLWIEGNWTLKPSDMDFYVLGRTGSSEDISRYGPYPLKVVGKSEEAKEPGFETNTNMSSEVIAFDMTTGINVLALHGVILNGSKPFEFVFGGGGGWIQVTPPEIKERREVRYGEKDMRMISNLYFPEGVTATAVGPAITESYKEVEIEQDYQTWWQFDNWGEYLQRGSYSKIINVSNVFILDIHIVGDDKAPDLDLGVFKEDEPPDGKLELEEVKDIYLVKIGGTKWDYDADFDADERVVWINPPNGQYIIKVLGFDIKGKFGHFDIDISMTLGSGEKGYWMTETLPNDVVVGTETGLLPYTAIEFTLHWNLQGSTPPGEYGGAVMIGTPSAPAIVVVPVTIIYDPNPPEILSFAISAIGYEIEIETNRTTNHPRPTLQVGLADPSRGELDWQSAEVFLDGENITSVAQILITFSLFEGSYGYWDGTITYTPKERMKDGMHTFDVRVMDQTGNLIEANYTFVVDTQAPFLEVNGPAIYSTQSDTAIISGYTEADKNVVIREFELAADSSGYFEKEIALEEGMNAIDIIAIDWFGRDVTGNVVRSNPNSAMQTIIYDTVAPVLSDVRLDTLTTLEFVPITGRVEEFIANATPYDPRTVDLRINGEAVDMQSDGMFEKLLSLSEGVNIFNVVATDAAGNVAFENRSITKDTSPPSLIIDEVPSTTDKSEIKITGSVEPGSILTVNGKFVSVAGDGTFEETVTLSSGPNVITAEAVDSAQNVRNVQVVIVREVSDISPYIIMLLLILIGLILGYLLGSKLRKSGELPEEEMLEEAPLLEEPSEEEVEDIGEGESAETEDVPSPEDTLNPHIEEELVGEEG
jgi:WD40 repeat protein